MWQGPLPALPHKYKKPFPSGQSKFPLIQKMGHNTGCILKSQGGASSKRMCPAYPSPQINYIRIAERKPGIVILTPDGKILQGRDQRHPSWTPPTWFSLPADSVAEEDGCLRQGKQHPLLQLWGPDILPTRMEISLLLSPFSQVLREKSRSQIGRWEEGIQVLLSAFLQTLIYFFYASLWEKRLKQVLMFACMFTFSKCIPSLISCFQK